MSPRLITPSILSVALASLAEAFPNDSVVIDAWPIDGEEVRYSVRIGHAFSVSGADAHASLEEAVYDLCKRVLYDPEATGEQRTICKDVAASLEAE